MNCVRGPEAWRPCSSRSSKQNTGTTLIVRARAALERRVVVDPQVAAEPKQRGM